MKIVGINGSLRVGSTTLSLVKAALKSAEECGAETQLVDLKNYDLPHFQAHLTYADHQHLNELLNILQSADGIILGSPEYHGTISGALKNFLDFQYRQIAGKAFGLVAATSGGPGIGCFDTMRKIIQSCHGWALPFNVAGSFRDVDDNGNITNDKLRDRIERLGRDISVYGPLLKNQFEADKKLTPDQKQSFAGWVM